MTNISVRTRHYHNVDPTMSSLLVESVSQESLETYDEFLIVKALRNELKFTDERAWEITSYVTRQLSSICEHIGPKSISTSLIRCVVNTVLHAKGTKQELKSANDISIPMYDIDNAIFNTNNENGNLEHNPESINFTLAERLVKEYALKHVFTKDVADAHLEGKIHVHDLGSTIRAYAFDGELNTVKRLNGDTISIQDVYAKSVIKEEKVEEGVYIKRGINLSVKDGNNFTIIEDIVRIEEKKDIFKLSLSESSVYVTEEHPCMVYRGGVWLEVPLFDVSIGEDMLYENTKQTVSSISQLKTNSIIYDVRTKSHTLDVNGIWIHNCSAHSIAYILRQGIRNVPNIMSTSAPANSAWTLARHICSMTQFYSSIFAGAIGWEAINVFFAPLLVDFSQKKLKQLAQTLIFDLSQLAGAKGGQTSFTDFNVYITIPQHYKEVLAIGKSGKFIGENADGAFVYFDTREEVLKLEKQGHIRAIRYKDFEKESQSNHT